MLGAALAPLLAVDAQAGTNLVQNGSFSLNTLPSPSQSIQRQRSGD